MIAQAIYTMKKENPDGIGAYVNVDHDNFAYAWKNTQKGGIVRLNRLLRQVEVLPLIFEREQDVAVFKKIKISNKYFKELSKTAFAWADVFSGFERSDDYLMLLSKLKAE